jgi:ferredoxin-NADP reductase
LPGQFLTLQIAPGGIPIKRSYTIASTPTWRDRVEITVKRELEGLVSRWLHDDLKPGDEVKIEAPGGTFIFAGDQAENVVLIGAGVGITPMMSVTRYLQETGWPGKVSLILGFRSPRDFIFREELEAIRARYPNLSVTVTMSNPGEEPWNGKIGRIDGTLLSLAAPGIASSRAHVCGPPSMMISVKASLLELGVHETQIKTEAFGTVARIPAARNGRSADIAGTVTFRASDISVPAPPDATILDVAEQAGVLIDNACRSGTCASCRIRLISGNVSMEVEDALTSEDKSEGYILACQAKIRSDIEVDA